MVTALPDGTKRVKITIESDCEQVKALAEGIEFLTPEDILGWEASAAEKGIGTDRQRRFPINLVERTKSRETPRKIFDRFKS